MSRTIGGKPHQLVLGIIALPDQILHPHLFSSNRHTRDRVGRRETVGEREREEAGGERKGKAARRASGMGRTMAVEEAGEGKNAR
eukprot:2061799-Rhodomonas_salina.1